MIQSVYVDRNSLLNRLDPRTKFLGWVVAFVLLLCFNHPAYLAGVLALLVLVAASAGLLEHFVRLRWLIAITFLISLVTWMLAGEGKKVLVAFGPFQITQEAMWFGVASGLRVTGMFVAAGVVICTTRPDDFHGGLVRLGLPYRVAFVFALAYRLVPLYVSVAVSITEAQMARGLDLHSGSVLSRLRKYSSVAVPLMIYAVRGAGLMTIGLWTRGFSSAGRRSSFLEYRLRGTDYATCAVLLSFLVGGICARMAGFGVLFPERI